MGRLEEMSEISPSEQIYGSTNKEPLLKKYNIPIQHFDFAYVDKCTDARELEKILHVLKSGEEGYYPDLLKRVEEKLSNIKPNSRYIRKLTRVLSKNEVDEQSSKEITEDLNSWLDDINKKNLELTQMKTTKKSNLPEVRKSKEKKEEKEDVPKRIKSTDYAAWDKYDVETEMLKMDLEDEKIKKEAEKMAKEKHKKRIVKFNEFTTTAEASFEAQRENIIGNEYFKTGDYENALEHYSNSIVYFPSPTSFANRGATYFSLKKYKDAAGDYIKALKYEPNNHEYLLKLGTCYSSLEKWSEALDCAETVIKLYPNNTVAQKLAEKAKKSGGKIEQKKVRLNVTNVDTKSIKTPKKSILKKEEKSQIIAIPGSSKMSGPYFKVIHSDDPNVISKETEAINNYPKRMFMTNIDIGSDEEDYDSLIVPSIINSPWAKKNVEHTDSNDVICYKKVSKNFKNKSKKKICQKAVSADKVRNSDAKIKIKENNGDELLKYAAPVNENDSYIIKSNEIYTKSKNEIIQYTLTENGKNSIKANETIVKNQVTRQMHQDVGVNRSIRQTDTNQNDIGGGGEPFADNTSQPNASDVNMPFSFIQAWQSVRRDDTYSGFASILRNLNVDRMTEVMGNKIDATILSEILNCLYRHFMVADEVERVYSILLNLCRLQRFCIVSMFLSTNDKRLVQNLFDFLKQHGHDLTEDVKIQYI
ncbi:hypothetical protein Trydic_g22451 [Trypoxylus dichotomus]